MKEELNNRKIRDQNNNNNNDNDNNGYNIW